MKNRVYTRAFKEKAVRLSHNPSTTIRQLAIDLGIKPARLYIGLGKGRVTGEKR